MYWLIRPNTPMISELVRRNARKTKLLVHCAFTSHARDPPNNLHNCEGDGLGTDSLRNRLADVEHHSRRNPSSIPNVSSLIVRNSTPRLELSKATTMTVSKTSNGNRRTRRGKEKRRNQLLESSNSQNRMTIFHLLHLSSIRNPRSSPTSTSNRRWRSGPRNRCRESRTKERTSNRESVHPQPSRLLRRRAKTRSRRKRTRARKNLRILTCRLSFRLQR